MVSPRMPSASCRHTPGPGKVVCLFGGTHLTAASLSLVTASARSGFSQSELKLRPRKRAVVLVWDGRQMNGRCGPYVGGTLTHFD